MPRGRYRESFDQVSEFGRGRIVSHRYCGLSFREIDQGVGRKQATMMQIYHRWMNSQRYISEVLEIQEFLKGGFRASLFEQQIVVVVAKVTDSLPACHEFEPNTAEEPPPHEGRRCTLKLPTYGAMNRYMSRLRPSVPYLICRSGAIVKIYRAGRRTLLIGRANRSEKFQNT
ncbi:hypothetical protein TNCV_1053581 [Trichonephila clavipes]|nr:hypothetical protein TNCV_1053581 [Trichonephila clavipes]